MKYVICLITCLILINSTPAQSQTKDMRYKKYAGRYGNTSGISLFEDGTYLLYGYATGVFGSYKFEKDQLIFYPDQQELFEVYAHENPSLKDSTRINFIGFERGGNPYVQFDQKEVQRVFNDDANCFDGPFVYLKTGKSKSFILSVTPEESSRPNPNTKTSWHYKNDTGYNDFIFVYNRPKREYEGFSAMISPTAKGDVIKLSNYGGDEGYMKQKKDDDQKQWLEILEWKEQYDQSKVASQNTVYANKHYKTFPEPDSSRYQYDTASNLYSDKSDPDNDDYYRQNQYSDPRYLRKYNKLQPESKNNLKLVDIHLAPKSIFFTVCGEGPENSYHYKGFEKQEEENQQMLQTTEPIKIPKAKE